jgi:CRP-like cAMP-binding protein
MLQLTRLRTNVSPACYPAPSPNPVAPYLIQNVRGNCVTHFAAGATLYCEHDAADQIYQVITGVVRTVTVARDGKRALRGFHVPGEIFGIECARTHRASAEAVCDARVLRRNGSITEPTLTSDEVLTRHLWNSVLQISKRAEDLSLLGRASALEKLSYFLLDLAERLGTMPAVQLPMSRQDIADYLGISSETVSRGFTVLRQKNAGHARPVDCPARSKNAVQAPRHPSIGGCKPRHMFRLARIVEAGWLTPPCAN